MAITIVGESVVGRRKLLEALRGNGFEVSRKFAILSKNHGATGHKAIDQRLLPHLQKLWNKLWISIYLENEERGWMSQREKWVGMEKKMVDLGRRSFGLDISNACNPRKNSYILRLLILVLCNNFESHSATSPNFSRVIIKVLCGSFYFLTELLWIVIIIIQL